jgi:hypothetical protein
MSFIILIAAVAILIEALVEYYNLIVVKRKIVWKQVVTLCTGIIVALLFNADLFTAIGIPIAVPFVGSVLTGVLCSRGSNYISDFVTKLRTIGVKKDV